MLSIAFLFFVLQALGTQHIYAQFYAVKSDLLGLATGNLNVEASAVIAGKWTLHLPATYNPWTFSDNRKAKQLTLQPGVRYWKDQAYGYGWFLGANAIVSRYNIGNIAGSKHRYDGNGVGAGLSAGFSLPFYTFWNVEVEAGVGGILGSYDKYKCKRCGDLVAREKKLFFVPTKLSVSLVYLF